jgi:hypothetical protein
MKYTNNDTDKPSLKSVTSICLLVIVDLCYMLHYGTGFLNRSTLNHDRVIRFGSTVLFACINRRHLNLIMVNKGHRKESIEPSDVLVLLHSYARKKKANEGY